MLMDKQNMFADNSATVLGQTLVGSFSATPVLATNVIDLGAAATDRLGNTVPSDVAKAKEIDIFCQVTEAVTSAGAATINFQIIQSAAANMGSPDVLESSGVLAKATLVVGYRPKITLRPGQVTKRYLSMQYVIGTADTTAGAFVAGLVIDTQSQTGI